MERNGTSEQAWVGFPESTDEQIEDEVVGLIFTIMKWKNRYNRPGAQWRVGTTNDAKAKLQTLASRHVPLGVSSWHVGSPMKAAQEIVEYHGMDLEGPLHEQDTEIYAYVDRPPTTYERKLREKIPLTRKHKMVFTAIKQYYEKKGQGPSKSEVRSIMGHRSITTTNDYLEILQRKNWIFVEEESRFIELI